MKRVSLNGRHVGETENRDFQVDQKKTFCLFDDIKQGTFRIPVVLLLTTYTQFPLYDVNLAQTNAVCVRMLNWTVILTGVSVILLSVRAK